MEVDSVPLDLVGLFRDYPNEVGFVLFVAAIVAYLVHHYTRN